MIIYDNGTLSGDIDDRLLLQYNYRFNKFMIHGIIMYSGWGLCGLAALLTILYLKHKGELALVLHIILGCYAWVSSIVGVIFLKLNFDLELTSPHMIIGGTTNLLTTMLFIGGFNLKFF